MVSRTSFARFAMPFAARCCPCRETDVFRQARRRATVFEYVRGRKGYGDRNDGEYGAAELRTDLLKLHQLAMAVFNEGARSPVGALFELAGNLNDQVFGLMTSLEQVQKTLSQLTALYPESLSYADPGDTD
jgi:hypothetical protein